MKDFKNNPAGYNIVSVTKDIWAFEVIEVGSFLGSFKEVARLAALYYNFELVELDEAIATMLAYNNNAAHFGSWGSFIYAFDKKLDEDRKAS